MFSRKVISLYFYVSMIYLYVSMIYFHISMYFYVSMIYFHVFFISVQVFKFQTLKKKTFIWKSSISLKLSYQNSLCQKPDIVIVS